MDVRNIAVLVDGKLYGPEGYRISPEVSEARAVTTIETVSRANEDAPPMSPIDEVVAMLARIVKLAQAMPQADQRKTRNFVEAARSTLQATTCLDPVEQQKFQTALRTAARGNRYAT